MKITKKQGSIIAFSSMALLSIAMLITQSIYMNNFSNTIILKPEMVRAIIGIAFASLATATTITSFYFFHFKKNNLKGFILLGVTLALLIVSFVVPLSYQKGLYHMRNYSAAKVYIVNVIFFSGCLVGASIGTGMYLIIR